MDKKAGAKLLFYKLTLSEPFLELFANQLLQFSLSCFYQRFITRTYSIRRHGCTLYSLFFEALQMPYNYY